MGVSENKGYPILESFGSYVIWEFSQIGDPFMVYNPFSGQSIHAKTVITSAL